jgi:hypothetical protein
MLYISQDQILSLRLIIIIIIISATSYICVLTFSTAM